MVILYILSGWVLTGVLTHLFEVFVYCRGPKHFIEITLYIIEHCSKQNKLNYTRITEYYKTRSPWAILLANTVVSCLLGPFMFYDLFRMIVLYNVCTSTNKNTTS